jgi:hypothetical protein
LLVLLTAPGRGQEKPDEAQLQAGRPTEIYVAPGHATTLVLRTPQKISAIALASPVLSYKYDKALNQLEITPTVRTGGVETNLNLRIGPSVYVLQVKVVDDVRAQFVRNFVLAEDAAATDEAGLDSAHPQKPEQIDIVGAAKALERAQTDPVFRQAQSNFRIEALDHCYLWNDCLVGLTDVAQFIDADLLVFRVQWVNRTDQAVYLEPMQYGLFVAGQKIPIAARYKIGLGPIIYPGQLETVYLAVQGYRLSRHNDWQLALPPDAAAVGRMLGH